MEITKTLEASNISANIANKAQKEEKLEENSYESSEKKNLKSEADSDIKLTLSEDGLKEAEKIDFFNEEANLEKLKGFKDVEMYGKSQTNIPASTVINLLI